MSDENKDRIILAQRLRLNNLERQVELLIELTTKQEKEYIAFTQDAAMLANELSNLRQGVHYAILSINTPQSIAA